MVRDFLKESRVAAAVALALALCAAVASAQPKLDDPNRQFSNISPLPGGGIAINSEGQPDGLGAVQINIPVAYIPSPGYFTGGAYVGKVEREDGELSNPTGVIGVGLGGTTRIYVSAMVYTGRVNTGGVALNGQVMVSSETESRPSVSIGVQDAFKSAQQKGYSVYAVATKGLAVRGKNVYASVGAGGGRFKHNVFGGLSYPVTDAVNIAAEWDGFQLNSAVAWRPAGREGRMTLLGGYNGQIGVLVGVGGVFASSMFGQ